MIILWIDPWTTTIWYAVIQKNPHKIELIDYWVVETPAKMSLEHKLVEIGYDISGIIEKYQVERLSVEKLFFNTNITTGIAVAHARWVVCYEAAKRWIALYEYTPLQIKKAITSNGRASKLQLQRAIQMIFWLSEIPKPDDAADAIAVAYMGSLER